MPYTNVIHVTDLQLPELELYSRFSENQLLHYYEPAPGIFIAESPIVAGRALDAGYDPISVLVEEGELHGSSAAFINRCGDIPVYTASMEVLTQITGFALTRGLLCAMRRRHLPSAADVCSGAKRIAILENIVNPTNIGAIFRSAAALNMGAVLLLLAAVIHYIEELSGSAWGLYFRFHGPYSTGIMPGHILLWSSWRNLALKLQPWL